MLLLIVNRLLLRGMDVPYNNLHSSLSAKCCVCEFSIRILGRFVSLFGKSWSAWDVLKHLCVTTAKNGLLSVIE